MKKWLVLLCMLGVASVVVTSLFRQKKMDRVQPILSSIAGNSTNCMVVFFHPECDICHNLLAKLDTMKLDGYEVCFVAPVSKSVADSALAAYWKNRKWPYRVMSDSAQHLAGNLQVEYIPTTYVVRGKVYRKYFGDECEHWGLSN